VKDGGIQMIKDRMKNGEPVLGTWCDIPCAATANLLGKAGLDFIIIDMEHGTMDYGLAQDMAMAAECEGCDPLVRVQNSDEASILRALDTGAAGIIVPHVENTGDVEKIIRFAKFCPAGERGFNPFIRAGGYHNAGAGFFKEQNDKTLIGIILEGRDGIENLEKILSYEEIDVVYLGAYDLSIALGIPGDVKNKKVVDAMDKAISMINRFGKAAGVMVHDRSDLEKYVANVKFIVYKIDTSVLFDGFSAMRAELDKLK